MKASDAVAISRALSELADAVKERLQDLYDEIAELRAEVERLKREPRKSVAQKLREKNGGKV
jgi:hypothetical protein